MMDEWVMGRGAGYNPSDHNGTQLLIDKIYTNLIGPRTLLQYIYKKKKWKH